MGSDMAETEIVIAYVLFGLGLVGFIAFIVMRMKANRAMLLAEAEKEVTAGDDQIEGQSEVIPEQFVEPDDDVLDEMQTLLDDAAESQGLEPE